jgi:hypothetical protein
MLECGISQCEGRERSFRSGTLHLIDIRCSNGVIDRQEDDLALRRLHETIRGSDLASYWGTNPTTVEGSSLRVCRRDHVS